MSGKLSVPYFENPILRLEFGNAVVRILKSVKYIRVEAEFCEGIISI